MFILSAFADEIGPDPVQQIDILKSSGVNHIEFRSIHGTNVLALSDAQIQDFKALLDQNGFKLSAIGSPIGKAKIDDPFEPHLEKFHRALELCRVFGTPNMRIFSYYPPEGQDWDQAATQYRQEVMDRMLIKCELARKVNVRLVHENEHRIYGDSPARMVDLLTTVAKQYDSSVFGAVYDAANYVFCGYDPWEGWEKTRDQTVHFHIKDWKTGEKHGSIPGEGHGQIPRVIADAVQRGYDGFATMEPHLLGGGPTGGQTGPDLFPKAIAAFKKIVEGAGGKYR